MVRDQPCFSVYLSGPQRDGIDSRSEKPARGSIFSAMQRQMSQDTILIVDSLNYIKGFRYQMYCAARELKARVCTVSVHNRRPPNPRLNEVVG